MRVDIYSVIHMWFYVLLIMWSILTSMYIIFSGTRYISFLHLHNEISGFDCEIKISKCSAVRQEAAYIIPSIVVIKLNVCKRKITQVATVIQIHNVRKNFPRLYTEWKLIKKKCDKFMSIVSVYDSKYKYAQTNYFTCRMWAKFRIRCGKNR